MRLLNRTTSLRRNPRRAKKKQKKHEPSDEELAQDDIIIKLQGQYRCEDGTCSSTYCFLGGPNAKHIKLTPLHFRTWAAAIQGKTAGVDFESPPSSPLFDAGAARGDATTDINVLASRRLRSLSASNSSNSSPNVNVSFEGLADMMAVLKGSERSALSPANINPAPSSKPLPPKMSLALFCQIYELSAGVITKLSQMELAGPHVLRKLSDADLVEDGALTKAQIAEVRDAEERWLYDMDKE
ncbi:hypothetical protein FA95DRAFT_1613884 [Auriscalpium vulgare]|uniref:Uncharacterized protein n=1 Tax=Auriscalpium vulgare TaxID=40419 RepID=A0ACB8R192_9AGAM|nr:hypothetical protein FA95DRAFT_1613884 [Auriscalpium vulgare]